MTVRTKERRVKVRPTKSRDIHVHVIVTIKPASGPRADNESRLPSTTPRGTLEFRGNVYIENTKNGQEMTKWQENRVPTDIRGQKELNYVQGNE
jgi:hypothetical protein